MPAPLGNQNAAKAKRWEAAILRAVEAWPKEPDTTDCSALMIGLNKAAHEFVKGVYERGDLGFFKEFGDRLEGKAAQVIAGDSENPLTVINKVERVIVHAKD
jgi:hypothetical protein